MSLYPGPRDPLLWYLTKKGMEATRAAAAYTTGTMTAGLFLRSHISAPKPERHTVNTYSHISADSSAERITGGSPEALLVPPQRHAEVAH